jgi:hypothetical protein
MAIKRDLLVDKLFDPKQFTTLYIRKEDEIKAEKDQIETITELLCDPKHKAARGEIFHFLKKEPRSVDVLIKAIAEAKEDKKTLTAVCWEADLDCARHLAFFTNMIMNENFEVALEAFTVIEHITGEIAPQLATDLIAKVKEAYKAQSDTPKATLLVDTVELLHRWE